MPRWLASALPKAVVATALLAVYALAVGDLPVALGLAAAALVAAQFL